MSLAYIKCVKGRLSRLRDSGELAQALINPTPAAIRNECLRLYPTRSGLKDRETLAVFFGHDERDGDLFVSIERVNPENLKALQNFFTGGTTSPSYKVVEMMAWLIDFQPRPYNPNFDYTSHTDFNTSEIQTKGELDNQEPGSGGENNAPGIPMTQALPQKQKQPSKWKTAALSSAVMILLGAGGYQIFDKGVTSKREREGNCMYWAGDHYETGACIQRGGDSVLAPFDASRYRNFRRIIDSSQITENSIGKVWYRLNNGKFEFYTMEGKHPVDGRNLRRLTATSYRNYQESLRK